MPPSKQTTIEDDVDDLDDVLDQFNAPAASSSSSKPVTAPTTSTAASASKKDEEVDDEDFARQFAAEMEAFMQGLVNPEGKEDGPIDPKAADQAEALRKAWEQLLVDDLEAMDLKTREDDDESTGSEISGPKVPEEAKGKAKPETKAKSGLGTSSQASTSQAEDEFQKAVRQAMEKLKESDDSNKADEADGDLASLLSAFSGLNFGKDGDEAKDVQGVLETLMGQLMSKEVLYEPLKELNDKFPGYLEENRGLIATADQARYDKQMSIVSQVIAIFEAPDYSDNNQAMTSEVISLMSEMQEYGSPPADIMGKLPPGFEVGSDGLPALDDKCIIS